MNRYTEIARRLGPERAKDALAAFNDSDPGGWHSCALARADGAPGELLRLMRATQARHRCSRAIAALYGADVRPAMNVEVVARIMGLPVEMVRAVVDAFDGRSMSMTDVMMMPYGERSHRQKLRAALEAEAAKCATRETATVA